MSEGEVVVKGEIHVSGADRAEAEDLLRKGVDCLVLENAKEESEFHLRYIWFHFLMWCLTHLFFKRVYSDPAPLEEITESQGGYVMNTRDSDIEIIANAAWWEEMFALLIFLVLGIGGIYLGMLGSPKLFTLGGTVFVAGCLLPPSYLRMRESERKDRNRDETIAGRVADAAAGGERVVAVVGSRHRDDVISYLPDWVNVTPKDAVYKWYHPWSLLQVAQAVLTIFILYGGLYIVTIALMRAGIYFLA